MWPAGGGAECQGRAGAQCQESSRWPGLGPRGSGKQGGRWDFLHGSNSGTSLPAGRCGWRHPEQGLGPGVDLGRWDPWRSLSSRAARPPSWAISQFPGLPASQGGSHPAPSRHTQETCASARHQQQHRPAPSLACGLVTMAAGRVLAGAQAGASVQGRWSRWAEVEVLSLQPRGAWWGRGQDPLRDQARPAPSPWERSPVLRALGWTPGTRTFELALHAPGPSGHP